MTNKIKIIKNNVVGSTYLYRTELKEFQEDLKLPNEKEIEQLASRIKRKGFDDPIKIWFDHDNYILDGHQRLKALNKLQLQNYMLDDDKVPVVFIKADTLDEAKEKVYEYNSKYSTLDAEFAKAWGEGLDLSDMNLPGLTGLDDIMGDTEPDNKDDEPSNKPFVLKITSKLGKDTLERVFKELEPILEKHNEVIDYSFSGGEL